jgi:hypothetical protein
MAVLSGTSWMTAALIVCVIILLLLVVQVFMLRSRMNRLSRKYKYFMGGHDGVSVERQLSAEIKELRDMVSTSEGMLHQQELLANMQLESFQRMGMINYDAFDSTGDKLSFSLTLLNGRNNGFVFTCLTGSGTARIYAKKVTSGRCHESLSSEEAESIEMALNTQMPNVVVEAQKEAARREEEREKRKHSKTTASHPRRRTNRTSRNHTGEVKAAETDTAQVQAAEPVKEKEPEVLQSATEEDMSIFSSHSVSTPRRGQYKVNHEEKRK